MIWQDIILAIGGFAFSIALIPALKDQQKPPTTTSIITGVILTMFCIIYLTLGLRLAALSTALTAACWWTLLVQRIRQRK